MDKKGSSDQLRYVAGVSYKGTGYYGWQRLKNSHRTIQQMVEEALSRIASHKVSVVCAGRTDAGVHASRQIIHFDSDAKRSELNWLFGANHYLPNDITINWVKPITSCFDARFSAISRNYIYIIYNHLVRSALFASETTWCHKPLNTNNMQIAADYLIGKHNFNAYRTVKCQAKHAIRKIINFRVQRINRFVILDIQANAFLHHMVRNIAGVLIKIGAGEKKPEWAQEVLLSEDRRCAGITAPPGGLYLADVIYPEEINLPEEPKAPLFISEYANNTPDSFS
ncbi:MAG: tRNA pseudouridine(38-40) synthase TruA [Endozoicomonadaceae bacterium]|nr:tRNA pseudouridine(38-40) synthase TruA [Endozoicomonadaceae bacterium]MCY4330624.1 tRNA pseudouridine(38-40) synthase TruA [Endozoicomonadaceae bacterium]